VESIENMECLFYLFLKQFVSHLQSKVFCIFSMFVNCYTAVHKYAIEVF